MDVWGMWDLSTETENRLSKICLKLSEELPPQSNNIWLELFNYNTTDCEMDVDITNVNGNEDEIIYIIKEALESGTSPSEELLLGFPNHSLEKILLSFKCSLNETEFSNFCKFIMSWTDDNLVENSLRLIVLPKLKETNESSALIIFSIKELALSKPDKLCHHVLVPLLSNEEFQFCDVELLSTVFPVLEIIHKDLLIMSLSKRKEFHEKDWLLLHPLIKDLPQNCFMIIIDCIQKFSTKFRKSQVFGRFLVNFCKNVEFIGNKDVLLKAVKDHQTLLSVQALNYLESS